MFTRRYVMDSGGGGGGLISPEVGFFVVYFFSFFKPYLMVHKREIFVTELFTPSNPNRVGA
jgi:hypothetical protein